MQFPCNSIPENVVNVSSKTCSSAEAAFTSHPLGNFSTRTVIQLLHTFSKGFQHDFGLFRAYLQLQVRCRQILLSKYPFYSSLHTYMMGIHTLKRTQHTSKSFSHSKYPSYNINIYIRNSFSSSYHHFIVLETD